MRSPIHLLYIALWGCGSAAALHVPDTAADLDTSTPLGASCRADDLSLRWVVEGQEGVDWTVNQLVDHDHGVGTEDFTGATGTDALTYDGHAGTDIDLPNFRAMDRGVDVLSPASGVILEVVDHHEDRHTTCFGEPNRVAVQLDNGFVLHALHLARGSTKVAVGERVEAGWVLGQVGSSGCSTQPHVHIELHDCDGEIVDPFAEGLWDAPPAYAPPLQLMDAHLFGTRVEGPDALKDPGFAPVALPLGAPLTVGLTLSGGTVGDRVAFDLVHPDGQVEESVSLDLPHARGRHDWWWNRGPRTTPGRWTVRVWLRGALVVERSVLIAGPLKTEAPVLPAPLALASET